MRFFRPAAGGKFLGSQEVPVIPPLVFPGSVTRGRGLWFHKTCRIRVGFADSDSLLENGLADSDSLLENGFADSGSVLQKPDSDSGFGWIRIRSRPDSQ